MHSFVHVHVHVHVSLIYYRSFRRDLEFFEMVDDISTVCEFQSPVSWINPCWTILLKFGGIVSFVSDLAGHWWLHFAPLITFVKFIQQTEAGKKLNMSKEPLEK